MLAKRISSHVFQALVALIYRHLQMSLATSVDHARMATREMEPNVQVIDLVYVLNIYSVSLGVIYDMHLTAKF